MSGFELAAFGRDPSSWFLPMALSAAFAAAFAAWSQKKRNATLQESLQRAGRELRSGSQAEDNLRAILRLEEQCIVRWRDGEPSLVANTLGKSSGVPSKLAHLLRFAAWIDPEDVNAVIAAVESLKLQGEPFTLTATSIEGQVLEIGGRVAGPDAILRIRTFTPVNKEIVRLMGENSRLRRTVADYQSLLNALPVPVWFRDAKGSLSWVNTAYAEAVNAKDADYSVAGKIELFETRQRTLLTKGAPGNKLRIQTVVNGGLRIYDAIPVALSRGSSGGAAFDVAPLASVEGELNRQTATHVKTLNKVSTGVAIFGSDRKLVYANDALNAIFCLDRELLEGPRGFAEFLDLLRQRRVVPGQPDYRKWRKERTENFERAHAADEFWHLPDGRSLHVLTDHREDGGATLLVDDVTEKLLLERRYHNLIEVQRETLDHLSEGIAVFGSDGLLQLYNPAFLQMWPVTEADLAGSPHIGRVGELCRRNETEAALWAMARGAVTGVSDVRDALEGTIQLQDQRHLSYAATPLPDGGTLLTFTDITDSKRIEVVLLEKNEALEASDRLKTGFLSHVSYELRTPLTSIIGFTDLLADPFMGPMTTRQREYLDDIKTSSQVLLAIINDILDLAVIDAGALDLKLRRVLVQDIVNAVELGLRERLLQNQLSLDIHIADGVTSIVADEDRMTQVLYNLLSNAIAFSPEGSAITLACKREKNGVVFSIQDSGLGIPEEDQAAVFERFEARNKGSRHRGAGLGLSLVKSLVELHSGHVTLRSAQGAGTTVSVFLPDRHSGLERRGEKADIQV